jgi:hypothetical protein
VYRLELALARLVGLKLGDIDFSYALARNRELRAWPAKDAGDVEQYLAGLCEAYESLVPVLAPSAHVCVVVGDCTMRKKLVPVHRLLTERMNAASFELRETIFRTTHYGIGKYAYDFRADYHGEDAEKKDAILVFEFKQRSGS